MKSWRTVVLCGLLSVALAPAVTAQDRNAGDAGSGLTSGTAVVATPQRRPVVAPLEAFNIFPPPTVWVNQLSPDLAQPGGRPAGLLPLYVSLLGIQAADAYTTITGVRGGAVERNAIVGAFGADGAGGIALKAASVAGTIFAAEHLWRRHPMRAIVLMTAVNCGLAIVAANNFSVIRRH